VLPLYARLERLDPTLREVASDLGATPWRTFLAITLPLSVPGIVAGSLLVFIPAVGEFVIPDLMGGPDTLMIGRVLWGEFFSNRDWPMSAALTVAMIVILVVPIAILQTVTAREEREARP
jgi:putrescine transport system permease protein